jgi:hypothetical protein
MNFGEIKYVLITQLGIAKPYNTNVQYGKKTSKRVLRQCATKAFGVRLHGLLKVS